MFVLVWLSWPVTIFVLNLVYRLKLETSDDYRRIDKHSSRQRAFQVSGLLRKQTHIHRDRRMFKIHYRAYS